METKRDIRKQMLCARDRLTDREWETYSDRITEQVVSHPLFVLMYLWEKKCVQNKFW